MNKNNLWIGLVYILVGAACLITAIFLETKLDSLLFGFSGAGIISGFVIVFKYFYWGSDKNKDRYAQRLDNEQIELQDERKEKLRDRSGRYAYIAGLFTIAFSIVVFAVLKSLGVNLKTPFFILYLCGYLIYQYIIGIVIYKHLNNKC